MHASICNGLIGINIDELSTMPYVGCGCLLAHLLDTSNTLPRKGMQVKIHEKMFGVKTLMELLTKTEHQK